MVMPPSGPTMGGYPVMLMGVNLGGATAVYFGTTPGVIQLDSATSMTVLAPAHAPGVVDITVVTPAGKSPQSWTIWSPVKSAALRPEREVS